jgi:uncharacterized protein (TIGR03086 family)
MTTTPPPRMDPAEQLEVLIPDLGGLIAWIRPPQMSLATPWERWTVRDLLNHVVGGGHMYVAALGGDPVQDISGRLPDALGEDPVTAFSEAAALFGAALQQPGAMERQLALPVGRLSGGQFLQFIAFDLLVHTWDLSTALGRSFNPPGRAPRRRRDLRPATTDPGGPRPRQLRRGRDPRRRGRPPRADHRAQRSKPRRPHSTIGRQVPPPSREVRSRPRVQRPAPVVPAVSCSSITVGLAWARESL